MVQSRTDPGGNLPPVRQDTAPEFYFPPAGGADPDFHLPAKSRQRRVRLVWLPWFRTGGRGQGHNHPQAVPRQ